MPHLADLHGLIARIGQHPDANGGVDPLVIQAETAPQLGLIQVLGPIDTMAAIFAFKCSFCGESHEGSPSFGLYDQPVAGEGFFGWVSTPIQMRRFALLGKRFLTICLKDNLLDRMRDAETQIGLVAVIDNGSKKAP